MLYGVCLLVLTEVRENNLIVTLHALAVFKNKLPTQIIQL